MPEIQDREIATAAQEPGLSRRNFICSAVAATIVEADGHEFHETEHFAARDKRRDRFLTAQGYRVMRFTGSEIHADARRCADEVIAIVMDFQTARVVAAVKGAA